MPIKISVLLDSLEIPFWVNELLKSIQSDYRYQICCITYNAGSIPPSRSAFGYRLLRNLDQRLMKLPGNPFQKVKFDAGNIPVIPVHPIRKKFSDYFPEEAIHEIKKYQPDIMLRFGFRILRGEILKLAPYGILSLHHGDTAKYRGGPPAFWEVVEKHPTTGVTLQVLTETLDAGVIIDKAFVRTDTTSFIRNQQKLYWAGLELFKKQLRYLASKGASQYFKDVQKNAIKEEKGNLYRNPGSLKSFKLLLTWFGAILFRRLRASSVKNQWQIIYKKEKDVNLHLDLLNFQKLIPPKDRIWADPFSVFKDQTHYVFLEEKLFSEPNAHISVIRLNDKGELIDAAPKQVLKTDHHLSYPFVFEKNGTYYMIPESGAHGKVILYESINFPYVWKQKKVLLDGVRAYDSTLHFHEDGRAYLFCTFQPTPYDSADVHLYIYTSSDWWNEPFEPHALNPVVQDVSAARSAGKVFQHNGKWIRPVQQCAPVYGHAIRFYEIEELSLNTFKQRLLSTIEPPKGMMASHTFNWESGLALGDIQVFS
jgi:folate-dependent phosphoribosylglycinamide formyltransferase PurN